MELQDYFHSLNDNFSNEVKLFLSNQVGLAAAHYIDLRVRQKGNKATGGYFSPYSPQYQKRRDKKRLLVSFKNFEFTSQMWNSIQVIGTNEISSGYYQTKVGSTVERTNTLLAKHEKAEGISLLELSKDEEEMLSARLSQWMKDKFDGK